MLFNAINAIQQTSEHKKNRDLLSIIEPNTIITNKNKDNTFKKTPPHINTILYRNECGLFN